MLLYDADPLFKALDPFLNLTVRKLDKCAGFSELFV